jgi:phosphotriesterase-related protein
VQDRVITSVLGELPASELGATACHEHLLIGEGHPVVIEPDFRLDDVEAAVREARELLAAGGAAVVDCMPLGVGRNPDGLAEVARRTGLTVLAVTGFHRDAFYPADHWVRALDVDGLTQRVIDDATCGMELPDQVPGRPVARSGSRPGLIKVAISGEHGTPLENALLEAVTAAAVATGLPVITHTESVAGAVKQVEKLTEAGVSPERVILSHMDRHGDLEAVAELCATGATVCLDWLGRPNRDHDRVVVELVVALIAKGYADKVVLGQDLARRQYWHAYGGGPGLAHLFTTVVPQLRQAGVSQRELDAILVDTPRRVLATSAK